MNELVDAGVAVVGLGAHLNTRDQLFALILAESLLLQQVSDLCQNRITGVDGSALPAKTLIRFTLQPLNDILAYSHGFSSCSME